MDLVTSKFRCVRFLCCSSQRLNPVTSYRNFDVLIVQLTGVFESKFHPSSKKIERLQRTAMDYCFKEKIITRISFLYLTQSSPHLIP